MARVKISAIPFPSTGKPTPVFYLSDDIEAVIADYRAWLDSGRDKFIVSIKMGS